MSLKEEFLKLKSVEEYLEKEEHFKNLKDDEEIIEHWSNLNGESTVDPKEYETGVVVDYFKKKPKEQIMGVFNFNDNSDEFEKALDEQLEAGLEAIGLAAEGFTKRTAQLILED